MIKRPGWNFRRVLLPFAVAWGAHFQHLQQGHEVSQDATDDEVDTGDQATQRGSGEDPSQEHPPRSLQPSQGLLDGMNPVFF